MGILEGEFTYFQELVRYVHEMFTILRIQPSSRTVGMHSFSSVCHFACVHRRPKLSLVIYNANYGKVENLRIR